MKTLRTVVLAGALAAGSLVIAAPARVSAQSAARAPSMADWPAAETSDVESIDALIAALYDVISGPAGEARDWDRFRSLFLPDARLIPTGRNPQGQHGHDVMTVEDYVTNSGPFLEERGFFEVESARTTERFGDIAHAFSTYESRWTLEDPDPFQRGINSIQLMNDGNRWWVVNIFWAAERPDMPIPERYESSRSGG